MRILVVGLGSIGTRHARNIRHLMPDSEIVALRQPRSETPGRDDGDRYVDKTVQKLDAALALDPDAAVIANPAPFHVPVGLRLGEAGVDLFIEKPLSDSATGVEELLQVCRSNGVLVHVGYNYRFYEPLRVVKCSVKEGRIGRIWGMRAEAGSYLPDWRPGSDYRQSVSARADLGGGAVLELSHELDYVRWIIGEPRAVRAELGCSGVLDVDVEDMAEIQLEFADGAVGSVHLDMLQRPPIRRLRLMGTSGVLRCDLLRNHVELLRADEGGVELLFDDAGFDRNEMYLREMECFLSCVQKGGNSPVPGEDGFEVLKIALAAKRSSEEGRKVWL